MRTIFLLTRTTIDLNADAAIETSMVLATFTTSPFRFSVLIILMNIPSTSTPSSRSYRTLTKTVKFSSTGDVVAKTTLAPDAPHAFAAIKAGIDRLPPRAKMVLNSSEFYAQDASGWTRSSLAPRPRQACIEEGRTSWIFCFAQL
ncbi:hypothetical protein FA95DRAFT_325263 [Auriscalpium vulgare]|uniref:Uncharacterized protein n=1 Tax=Auriscalpium vulgare TaxID=40419 RepID=A0ACB8RJF2_9AGAM|nr:hypothetical protein FA95DRAFT_325263 [Auriscalpium vulgare]